MACHSCWHHRLAKSHTADYLLHLSPDYMVIENCHRCRRPHYPTEKICPNDHKFCQYCSFGISKCTTCRDAPLRHFRDRAARIVDFEVRYPCWYKDLGCTEERSTIPRIKAHENVCVFGQRQCSTRGCVSMSVTKRSFFNHLMGHRGQVSLYSNTKALVQIYFMHRRSYDLLVFLVLRDKKSNCLRFAVYSVSNKASFKNKYKFQMKAYPVVYKRVPEKIKDDYTNDLSDFSLNRKLNMDYDEALCFFVKVGRAAYRFLVRIDIKCVGKEI